jgi:hypothetical protein
MRTRETVAVPISLVEGWEFLGRERVREGAREGAEVACRAHARARAHARMGSLRPVGRGSQMRGRD